MILFFTISGFVGLFNLIILWPGILLLHFTSWETFTFPSKNVWLLIIVNGVVGTVLSEMLWLWYVLSPAS